MWFWYEESYSQVRCELSANRYRNHNRICNIVSERIETSLCALFLCKGAENMAETKNEQQPHSFKRKLGNTTYTVKVHFSKDTDKTFKDRVQKLIINECLEKNQK